MKEMNVMVNIEELSLSQKKEIAAYIKNDTLKIVNESAPRVKIRKSFYTCFGKRVLDIIVSLIVIIVTLPINFMIAVITFFDVGRPLIFCQRRIGKDNKPFTIYKFRNMKNTVDAKGELLPASQRVTKWGKFVRKTSLDELLNFVSILKGDMSLIGPRPLLDYYADRLSDFHRTIYQVRPGLECPPLKKVNHVLSWQERLDNYVWYVENCSFWLDIRLMFRVVEIALDHDSVTNRSNASSGGLMGYDQNGNIIYSKAVPDQYVEQFLTAHKYNTLSEAIENRFER